MEKILVCIADYFCIYDANIHKARLSVCERVWFDANLQNWKEERKKERKKIKYKNHEQTRKRKTESALHLQILHRVAMRKIALHLQLPQQVQCLHITLLRIGIVPLSRYPLCVCLCGLEPFSLNVALIPSTLFRLRSRFKTCNSSISIFYICNREVLSRNSRP